MGYSPWGRTESDTTERLTHTRGLKEVPTIPVVSLRFVFACVLYICKRF